MSDGTRRPARPTRTHDALAELVRALEAESGLSVGRERRLVQRVLARTTREDPGWRGDVTLFAGFVRSRLVSSRVLRLVAASLIAHLVALPVFAWLAHREPPPPPGFRTAIEWPGRGLADEAPEPERPIELPADYASLDLDQGPRAPAERVENVLRRDRFVLQQAGRGEAAPAPGGGSLKMRLLDARSSTFGTRGWNEGREAELVSADAAGWRTLEQVLQAELALDRFVLHGERPATLPAVLVRLSGSVRDADARADAQRALAQLAAATLDRARAYGLWDAPSGFDPLATPAPLEDPWRAALARAWNDVPGDEPLPAAWRAR